MKRKPTDAPQIALPDDIRKLFGGARIYDSSSSPEARVYFIEKNDGYYLKLSDAGTLEKEAKMTAYFHGKGLGAEVLSYTTYEGKDILLTARMRGEDCTHGRFLSEPRRLCDTIAENLRLLHESDYSDCPVMTRTEEYIRGAKENFRTGNYDSSHFPDSFGYRSADEAMRAIEEGEGALRCDTLLHGDYCLPNIMLNEDFGLSGYIDLGGGGVGDRHIDLFWGAWTLGFNLGTDRYRERFFDAYGRDKVDKEILRIVAAAEVFG